MIGEMILDFKFTLSKKYLRDGFGENFVIGDIKHTPITLHDRCIGVVTGYKESKDILTVKGFLFDRVATECIQQDDKLYISSFELNI